MNPNSRPISMDKMTDGTLKRLQKYSGTRNIFEMVALALAEGARLGRGEINQQVKATQYFVKKYNADLQDAKEKQEILAARIKFLEEERLRSIREKEAKIRKAQRQKELREERKYTKKIGEKPETRVFQGRQFKIQLIDRINMFRKYLVRFARVESLREFYDTFTAVSKEVFEGDIINIALYFHQDDGVATRSISANDLTTYDDFTARLLEVVKGGSKAYGSDAIEGGEAMLIPTRFLVNTYTTKTKAYGKSDTLLFEHVGIESKKKQCAYDCLVKLGFGEKLKGVKPEKLADLDYLKKILEEREIKVRISSNIFTLKKFFKDMGQEPVRATIKNRQKIFKNLTIDDIDFASIYPEPKEIERAEEEWRKLHGGDYDCAAAVAYYYDEFLGGTDTDEARAAIDKAYAKLTPRPYSDWPYLVYDELGQHIDICKGEPTLLNDVKVDAGLSIWLGEKEVYKARVLNTVRKNVEFVETLYVFFDYETIVDFDHHNCMKEYSLSILALDKDELNALNNADKKHDEATVAKLRREKCTTFLGFDCSQKFIEWILDNQTNRAMIFISFNGVVFDNFFFLDALLRNTGKFRHEYDVDRIFYNGSQLMNFTINGRHNTFDIHKHLVGSLASNCKSFKINCCAKKSFDHALAQELFDSGKLIDFVSTSDELREYNEYDVLATAVLYARYAEALGEINCTKKYSEMTVRPEHEKSLAALHKMKTIGSLIYSTFTDHCQKNKISLPTIEWKWYKDLQRCKVAGRVEMFNGIQETFERLASTDVCSLYPFVMSVLNVFYPCGDKIIEVDSYQGDDRLGFYYCDFDQSNLPAANLPNIYPLKTGIENKWDHVGPVENYLLSNVMIGLLKKHGCRVDIRNGFVFPDQKKSCEMFGFQLDIMKAKNLQDTLKDSKDPEDTKKYNSALRDTLKLLINSLSGKVIESLHCEKVESINSVIDYEKIAKKAESINAINNIGHRVFVSYTVSEEDICEKQQRPIYLGVLLYDYAKRYMYEMSYSKIGKAKLLYTDTDASKFPYTEMPRWRGWIESENVVVPHWPEVELYDERYKTHLIYQPGSKVFGSFEDELEDMVGEKYTFYCLQKKTWLYAVDDKVKYRFKGLSDSAIPLDLSETFLKRRMEGDGSGGQVEKIFAAKDKSTQLAITKYLNDNKTKALGPSSESPKYKSLSKEDRITHSAIQLKMYKDIYDKKPTHMLCSSFRKIVKNSLRGVGLKDSEKFNKIMNRLQLCYMIKKITV